MRQARDKLLVRLIDKAVLVAYRVAVGDPHADVLVGADRLRAPRLHLVQRARNPPLDVLYGSRARGDHLEGGVERVEVKIEHADHHAGDEPQLERHIGRAELHRRKPDVMMSVDEAGQQDLLARADHRRVRMAGLQLRVSADLADDAILLQHGTIGDLFPGVAIARARNRGATADERDGHRFPFSLSIRGPLFRHPEEPAKGRRLEGRRPRKSAKPTCFSGRPEIGWPIILRDPPCVRPQDDRIEVHDGTASASCSAKARSTWSHRMHDGLNPSGARKRLESVC